MATSREIHTPLEQRPGALGFAAEGTAFGAQGTERPGLPPAGLQLIVGSALASAVQSAQTPPANTCQQCLTLSFFFDGTGNNLDADVGSLQHSNVARLFQSHQDNEESRGLYAFYIPGLGTYFKEIGDPGNTTRGKGMGHMGQDRLDWAFRKFNEAVKKAAARAQNPTNKLRAIRVNVFGFSRGATAARAFVRDLAARCTERGGACFLKEGNHPVEVAFLGLFDTVASVGLPMSANNTPGATSMGLYRLRTTLKVRAESSETSINRIAFGTPGADPAPGSFDGHASWADGLTIPKPLVARCVHMVAAHEIRNSFPVDSVLNGRHYPDGVEEMVYPGAHSDVGGGYQPGEGARSEHHGEMFSLIPLRVMHAKALEAGVPLLSLAELNERSETTKLSFALDDKGAQKFADLLDHFRHYMKAAGSGGRDVGKELLAHGHLYLRWRFQNIRRNREAAARQAAGPEAQTIQQREARFKQQRTQLDAELKPLKSAWEAAQGELRRAETALQNARYAKARWGQAIPPETERRRAVASDDESRKKEGVSAQAGRTRHLGGRQRTGRQPRRLR
ncbi:T6SS phospholipase effector Tle1-like catalytic domain-containing protein [Candidatus Dactylopiibacterium carminicum]|uniref:T6SS phospholipase effector Tle1-like catalytic domain-containing protein n=1 Tax=Candidatus Dactylopiibacterium carminicum TaxID=857335 RepID=UPI001483C5A1|nr:DUF2235 domain-containing protein [Candidatus Dactylopiibacterium carminicum]